LLDCGQIFVQDVFFPPLPAAPPHAWQQLSCLSMQELDTQPAQGAPTTPIQQGQTEQQQIS
jgi:hypothetical protein